MRNLTIRRNKALAASLVKMKVYIEDHSEHELTIAGVPCRKLGDLKNGEEKTFSITDEAVKVFVIGDKLSRNAYNEFYPIQAGTEDVVLSGRNYLNPFSGNPFRFDGVTDEAVLKNRKKGSRTGIIIMVAAVLLGLIGGSIGGLRAVSTVEPKTFSEEGLSITLTNKFFDVVLDGYTAAYGTDEVVVLTLKESFSLMAGLEDYTLREYGELIIEANGMAGSVTLQERDGMPYFTYQYANPETKEIFDYTIVLFKSDDAFWTVQFATPVSLTQAYEQSIFQWASSVTFE